LTSSSGRELLERVPLVLTTAEAAERLGHSRSDPFLDGITRRSTVRMVARAASSACPRCTVRTICRRSRAKSLDSC
jgi:hypothetical protein